MFFKVFTHGCPRRLCRIETLTLLIFRIVQGKEKTLKIELLTEIIEVKPTEDLSKVQLDIFAYTTKLIRRHK